MKGISLVVLLIAIAVIHATVAFADDSVASVSGQSITPISGEDKHIRLEREVLDIRFAADGYAYVDVTFFLRNESKRKVSLWVGFPDERETYYSLFRDEMSGEMGLGEDQMNDELLYVYAGYSGWIEDFTATVNGEPIEWQDRWQTVKYDQDKASDLLDSYWSGTPPESEFPYNLGPEFLELNWYTEEKFKITWKSFKLDFKPNETIEVRHTFRASRGGGMGYAPHMTTNFDYTLVTGRSWKGTIGELIVTATLDPELNSEWILGTPVDEWRILPYEMEETVEWYEDEMLTTDWLELADSRTLRGVKKNWEPSAADTPVLRLCAWEEGVYWIDITAIFPESSARLLTDEEIDRAPLSYLVCGQYEIYARHGKPFVEEDDRMGYWYITGLEWYTPDPTYIIPDDDVKRLNWYELENLKRLAAEEQSRRYPG